MKKFEVGRITELKQNKNTEESKLAKQPIGFKTLEKTDFGHKLDQIGFSGHILDRKATEESDKSDENISLEHNDDIIKGEN